MKGLHLFAAEDEKASDRDIMTSRDLLLGYLEVKSLIYFEVICISLFFLLMKMMVMVIIFKKSLIPAICLQRGKGSHL